MDEIIVEVRDLDSNKYIAHIKGNSAFGVLNNFKFNQLFENMWNYYCEQVKLNIGGKIGKRITSCSIGRYGRESVFYESCMNLGAKDLGTIWIDKIL